MRHLSFLRGLHLQALHRFAQQQAAGPLRHSPHVRALALLFWAARQRDEAVAQWPGYVAGCWAFRRELKRFSRSLPMLSVVAFVGGIVGGLLLLATSNAAFAQLIPWLLLLAILAVKSAFISVRLQRGPTLSISLFSLSQHFLRIIPTRGR